MKLTEQNLFSDLPMAVFIVIVGIFWIAQANNNTAEYKALSQQMTDMQTSFEFALTEQCALLIK